MAAVGEHNTGRGGSWVTGCMGVGGKHRTDRVLLLSFWLWASSMGLGMPHAQAHHMYRGKQSTTTGYSTGWAFNL